MEPQRWHFANARNIQEQTGSGTLGGAITLTNPPAVFPSGVTGMYGNASAGLSWLPVPGATSYNIRYSTMNGGPYSVVAGSTVNTNYVVGGLTNGQTYYFAVTAVQSGVEQIPSEQVPITPFDTTQKVLCTGSMTEGGQFTPVIQVSSSALSSNQPSYVGAEHYTGVLNLRELDYYGYGNLENESVGTQGYTIFDWQGPGTGLTNIPGRFKITMNSGWYDAPGLERTFRVDNVLGTNNGIWGGPLASLNIAVSDTSYHFLTVVSPAQYANPRVFTLRLTSTNNTSAAFTLNESPGLSHVFQFMFSGNVTLWADATVAGGSDAVVQALFFDNAPVTFLPPSAGSTNSSGSTNTPSHTSINSYNSIPIPRKQITVSAPTTVYLVGTCYFSAGSVSAFGQITARRMR